MSEPFTGQVEIFGFAFAPRNWAQCNGQLMAISQNQALFSLLGTTYGGDGRNSFGLPNLQSRVPMGMGKDPVQDTWTLGQAGGSESIKLTSFQLPAHIHQVRASSSTDTKSNTTVASPSLGLGQSTGLLSDSSPFDVLDYVADAAPAGTMGDSAISPATGGQPHENRMPLLAMNFCICLAGLFPSRG